MRTQFCFHQSLAYLFLQNKLEWYCYFLILVCLFTLSVGLLGNTLALGHYTYCMKTWTTSTIFLFNLALCDLTWILMSPFSVYYSLQKLAVHSSQTFYQVRKLFFNINIYGSVYFLTLISFDRYVGAVHPITSLTWWDKGKAMFCTIAVWIFIVVESVPEIYYTFAAGRHYDGIISLDNIAGPLRFPCSTHFAGEEQDQAGGPLVHLCRTDQGRCPSSPIHC
uniref:G-protein coupled receptors family 1 profile domain-containing protein n=1 Tax=Dromaius novaehollandiae TaxID=8790 RepID=A0A8C4J0T3_DRONO